MTIKIDWYKFRNPTLYPEYQTEDICLEAVKRNGLALKYAKDQTEDICLEAVKRNGFALKYVKDQTENICIFAAKRNGLALKYVKDQTENICLEALKNRWHKKVYDIIDIPIEGNLLKEINKMKLINGSMK